MSYIWPEVPSCIIKKQQSTEVLHNLSDYETIIQTGITCKKIRCYMRDLACKWFIVNPLSTKLRKWPNKLKQFVGKLPTNCLSVFGHFVG